jgi:cell wall-associated NlpC family hydrolase
MPSSSRNAPRRKAASANGKRVKLATGLLAATAVITPTLTALPGGTAHASVSSQVTATKVTTVAKVAKKKKKRSQAQRQKIVAKVLTWAKRQKGKPYVYGAAGPNAFDCSGFVGYVYKKAGVRLPRTTGSIYAGVKHKVSWKNLRVGDLVFFYGGRSHVGLITKIVGKKIYMTHSPHTGDHVRQVLLNKYRKQTFNGAVRPV